MWKRQAWLTEVSGCSTNSYFLRTYLWKVEKRLSLLYVARVLDELCPTVTWKAGPVREKLGYFPEAIYKQNAEGADWFLLTYTSEM